MGRDIVLQAAINLILKKKQIGEICDTAYVVIHRAISTAAKEQSESEKKEKLLRILRSFWRGDSTYIDGVKREQVQRITRLAFGFSSKKSRDLRKEIRGYSFQDLYLHYCYIERMMKGDTNFIQYLKMLTDYRMEKEKCMKNNYKMALSYARKDAKIARILGEQLRYAFGEDGFFMDEHSPEELSNAEPCREKLKDIFKRSDNAVILYSERYNEGNFTHEEKEQIFENLKTREDFLCFIINISKSEKIDEDLNIDMKDVIYISLQINGMVSNEGHPNSGDQEADWENVREQMNDIVQHRIKRTMMLRTLEKMKDPSEYRLRIQTLSPSDLTFSWDRDYEWNILGGAYIKEDDGRLLREDTLWQPLWKCVEKDYKWIKGNLERLPDVRQHILFFCHLSIAYKLGQMYGDIRQASGNRNLVLVSSNRNENIEFALNKRVPEIEIEDFCQQYDGNCQESKDIAFVISIKPNEQGKVLETVKRSLEQNGEKYCKIYLFQKKMLIKDADMLEGMAAYLREKMLAYKSVGYKIHLFPDTTAPLLFVLGARSVFPGTVQLYDFIPKEERYVKSLTN